MVGKLITELLERPLKKEILIHGRFKINSFIAKGSYGMVYNALDIKTNETVIVKQLRKRKKRNRQDLLIKEAKILSALDNPAIPKCIDFLQEKENYFLLMEYIEGKNFEDLILNENQKYSERECLMVLLKVLDVVAYFHEKGIIHRDLRLPNIILKDQQIYIIDFGLAVYADWEEPVPPKPMPIEKKLFREISVKSDFYALGHFLLFLLYSDFEATSKKESSWEEELDIGDSTKKIIRKMLQVDEGYESVNELINDVENTVKSHRD